jgi:hypothetical protein
VASTAARRVFDRRNCHSANAAVLPMLLISACGSGTPPMTPTPPPAPTGDPPTANVYILPGALALGVNAFGDEAIVIFKGERMRWRNMDSLEHTIVPDTPSLPEFDTTGALAPEASGRSSC